MELNPFFSQAKGKWVFVFVFVIFKMNGFSFGEKCVKEIERETRDNFTFLVKETIPGEKTILSFFF